MMSKQCPNFFFAQHRIFGFLIASFIIQFLASDFSSNPFLLLAIGFLIYYLYTNIFGLFFCVTPSAPILELSWSQGSPAWAAQVQLMGSSEDENPCVLRLRIKYQQVVDIYRQS